MEGFDDIFADFRPGHDEHAEPDVEPLPSIEETDND